MGYLADGKSWVSRCFVWGTDGVCRSVCVSDETWGMVDFVLRYSLYCVLLLFSVTLTIIMILII